MSEKEKTAVSIDAGLKDEILKVTDNFSAFVNEAIKAALKKCPTCGQAWPKEKKARQ